MIASFFPDKLKTDKVYFSTAIKYIPIEFQESPNYGWLKDFKDTHYKKLNELRKQVVHYTTTDTDYRHKHLQIKDRIAMEVLHSERENLPEYYKEQIQLSLVGFEKTMQLLEEFNTILF